MELIHGLWAILWFEVAVVVVLLAMFAKEVGMLLTSFGFVVLPLTLGEPRVSTAIFAILDTGLLCLIVCLLILITHKRLWNKKWKDW